MSNLIERLRRYSYQQGTDDELGQLIAELVGDIHEAADALEAMQARIAELEADVARLREQRDSLQAKVHLCTAYDYLEKRVAELEGDLEVMRLQRDAKRWTDREDR